MDVGDDSGANGVWMTYGEIAIVRGIKRVAAIRLVQRHKWRKQAGNDGLARILVPPEWAKPGDRAPRDIVPDVTDDVVRDDGGDVVRVINALETSIASLAERAEVAERRADQAESRADRAEHGRDAERARADVLRDRVDAMQVAAAALQAQLAAAEAEGDALTVETAELTAQVKAARAEAREAQDAAEELRLADAARRGRGRLARLRAAWREE